MPLRFAPVRAAVLALVVLFVTAGFLGMHVLAAHEAHAAAHAEGVVADSSAPASGASSVERTTAGHAHVRGVAGAGLASGEHMDRGMERSVDSAGGARLSASQPGERAACHAGCPPSGVGHATDCTPAPGVPAPVPPAVVVLSRSDARPVGGLDRQPTVLTALRAPSLDALSISRT
ncbi:hypothetical protein [Sinomonas sp. ASV322]|uniref:hypothetical protein n=1 Tax=Sinomonas sp. ASV322 TaxID=3041920 RepID=UPI0027DAFA81|nr:hypothetical protein [Sinomonas sp. ASV322]MDQ4503414.1 hypothetical protein [Sinomonas sp. ASV322]